MRGKILISLSINGLFMCFITIGLQKGTQSFARATAMEAIKLSARFASGAQVILEQADDFFSSSSTSTTTSRREQVVTDAIELYEDEEGYIYATTVPSKTAPLSMQQQQQHPTLSKFAHQPSDLAQGFQYAYQSLSRNLGAAAETIFAVPTEVVGEENGHHAKAVIRAVPVAVIKPMIGLTGAFHSIMVGLRNSIDPNMRLQNQDVSTHEHHPHIDIDSSSYRNISDSCRIGNDFCIIIKGK